MDGLADTAVDRLAAQNTASDVDDLQGGLAFIGDNLPLLKKAKVAEPVEAPSPLLATNTNLNRDS